MSPCSRGSRALVCCAWLMLFSVLGCGGGGGAGSPGSPPATGANQAPTLSTTSPSAAAIGSSDFTLTVTGSNFAATSVVLWNGVAKPTTFTSSWQLTASIPGTDIKTFTTAQIQVYTPSPGGGTSASLPFNTYLALPANDLIYNPATQLIYASVPSSAGRGVGNSIVSIDPYTGLLTSVWVGSEPNRLALSSDGSTLWVGLDGAGAVRQVNLGTHTAGVQFSLGGISGVYNTPNTAATIAVMPGFPNTVAVAQYNSGTWWNGAVTVYDNGVARANTFSNNGAVLNVSGIAFSPSGGQLYASGYSGYAVLTVDATGISSSAVKNTSDGSSAGLTYDNGKVFLPSGAVLDAVSGTRLGGLSASYSLSRIAADSTISRAYLLANPNNGGRSQINVYDLATYGSAGSIPTGYNYSPYDASPFSLIRWGQDGLAFSTGTQIYVLRSPLVRDLSSTLADLGVSVTAPGTLTAGTDITYNVSVTNAGPVAAAPTTLIDTLPNGAVFKTVTTSQGTCYGLSVVRCALGTINASGSATVQIVATLLSPGTATNTATVSALQGDPNTANNSAATNTTASGTAYNPVPVLIALSPSGYATGSSGFTLAAYGSGFAPASILEWNGAALPTTYVSTSELTAQVDAAKLASLGWAWVTVSSPGPGGGVSNNLPFTVFQTISLTSNHVLFDPFTRKIYASIPSTATQVTGNSMVAIDPYSGTVGAPLVVGSEPNKLAESDDGQYLYVGLDGSKSITRIDLTSMTQAGTYPVSFTSFGSPTTTTARDIAVMPGNHDTLAVDTGSWTGNGILDIAGATGTFRTNLTNPYTGSNLAFANASTVYSYDIDTSGATFNRWTVGASGLVAVDENTLPGMAGGFKLKDGLVYGFSGGVADPGPTPPQPLGTCQIPKAAGSNQSVESSGAAPDPASGLIFYGGTTLAGSSVPLLIICDSNRFAVSQTIQLPGQSLTPTDLIRWGNDGLAFQMKVWPFGGSSTILLIRGPVVLPQWYNTNPTPTVASTTPTNTAAGSGNLTLSVTGSNFVPGALVFWKGAERTTTYVDASHLTAAIPASDLAVSGTANVAAANPGSGTSASVTFTIN